MSFHAQSRGGKKKKKRTFDQGVLVGGRRAGEDSEFGPDLVYAFLFNLEMRDGKR